MKKHLLNFVIIVGISILLLEAILWFVPVFDPYPVESKRYFNRYLPSWNHWAWNPWSKNIPPFEGEFRGGLLNGIKSNSAKYSINKYGFLYPIEKHSRASENELRIGIIGGSTVECIALEEGSRWPDVLATLLSKELRINRVSVLNLGVSAQATPTHLATVVQHASKLDLDILVFMLGANDLNRASYNWDPMVDDDSFYAVESNRPKLFQLIVTRTQLGRRLQALRNRLSRDNNISMSSNRSSPYFSGASKNVRKLSILPYELKLSAVALKDYQKDIISLASVSNAHNISVLFTTQPMLWKEKLSQEEDVVNWLSTYTIKEKKYRLKSGNSARLLETLNLQLLETCSKYNYHCLDLDKLIPRTLEYFYDSVHFNEKGARAVAEHVAKELRAKIITKESMRAKIDVSQ